MSFKKRPGKRQQEINYKWIWEKKTARLKEENRELS
jgi:hypothetical protein